MINKITLSLLLILFSLTLKLNAQNPTATKSELKGAARQVNVAKDTVSIRLLTEKTYAENGALIGTHDVFFERDHAAATAEQARGVKATAHAVWNHCLACSLSSRRWSRKSAGICSIHCCSAPGRGKV